MDIRKAPHVTAAFLLKDPKRHLPKFKLMKLIYLAERLSLKIRGFPMVYDCLALKRNGPVLVGILNLIEDRPEAPKPADDWFSHIAPHERYREVYLAQEDLSPHRLGTLSPRDMEIIDKIWHEYGHMTSRELVDLTHDLPEYKYGKCGDLDYCVLLIRGLLFDEDTAEEVANDISFHQDVVSTGQYAVAD